MRKLLFVAIIIVTLAGITYAIVVSQINFPNNETSNDNNQEVADIQFTNDDNQGIKLTVFDNRPLQYIYRPKNKSTFRDLAIELNLRLAINGGYFQGKYTDAMHAGLLYINGQKLAPLASTDKQITHIVTQEENNQLMFTANQDFRVNKSQRFAFQTGPLLLEHNVIQTDYINNSANGAGQYKRTIFGFTKSGKTFFLITSKPYKLVDLAQYILTAKNLAGEDISAINLDGGPSTAMYSKDKPLFNYNTSWFLPIIIGF